MAVAVYQSLQQTPAGNRPCVLLQRLSGSSYDAQRAEAHALLQQLIARRQNCPPGDLTFIHEFGQPPRISGTPPGQPSAYSLSYAGQWVALAHHSGGAVGIDLAEISLPPDWTEVAALYFSPAQQRLLAQQPAATLPQQFTHTWAELEARSKYAAQGLQAWSAERDAQLGGGEICWLDAPDGLVLCWAGS